MMGVSLDPQKFPIIDPLPADSARPFWSVIVPAYKPQFLEQALRSVLEQDPGRQQMQIVVIDDCSPHALEPIVRQAAGDRVVYVRQERNLGTYATQNAGLALSRGQWIHILNDDDWVSPGFYSIFRASLENQPPTVGVACCRYANTDAAGNRTWTAPPSRPDAGVLQDWLSVIGVSNPTHPVAVVVRRSTHERVGGYCPLLKYVGDWEFFRRSAIFFDWWYEPALLACYREHSHAAGHQATRSAEMIDEFGKAIDIDEPYLPPERRAQLAASARQAYANFALVRAEQFLNAADPPTALRILQAGLRLSTSEAVLQNVLRLLAHPAAKPFRELLPQFIARIQSM
jgi:glycosyltransferase involved in cell wall biosynthesis